jgi:hypothetical protein
MGGTLYGEELVYAKKFLQQEPCEFSDEMTENETIKYFNNNYYPGFEVGLRQGVSSFGFSLVPDFRDWTESFVSAGMSYTFTSWFDTGVSVGLPSPFLCEWSADFQLLRTEDRRLGISLEAIIFYLLRDEVSLDGEIISLESPLHFINGGLKPGIGFYILPDLFIGGYFQYNFFNEYYPFEYNTDEIHAFTYSPNAYRITLKYVFMKKADLDISYWNNELYIGANAYFYSYNLFIGYGVLENRFYIKLNSIDLL